MLERAATDNTVLLVCAEYDKLAPGVFYTFRVRGINVAGQGRWSGSTLSCMTQPDRPAPPSAPFVIDRQLTSLTFKWLPPVEEGGSAITGYRVKLYKPVVLSAQQRNERFVTSQDIMSQSQSLSPTSIRAPAEENYKKTNRGDNGEREEGDVEVELEDSLLGVTSSLTTKSGSVVPRSASNISSSMFLLLEEEKIVQLSRSTVQFTWSGLSPGKSYYLQVSAENEMGVSDFSLFNSFEDSLTLIGPPPTPEKPPRPVAASWDSLTLEIDLPGEDNGSEIFAMEVQARTITPFEQGEKINNNSTLYISIYIQ